VRAAHNGNVKILLVEDDIGIAEPLAKGLEREGFEVIRAGDGQEALEAPAADVVILDLRLPDIDGYEVCRRLRARSQVPIIMVSARGEEVDRVIGLELGADDYIVKPFGFRELVARIRAVTRRTGAPLEHRAVLRVVDLELDRRSRRASRGGRELALTPREFDLLALLMEEAGAALPRTRIMEEVWDSHWYGPSKTLDVHVASLRKKLGDPRWIETVRAVGFRLGSPNGGG
jgi:two-component system response regulator RegX3